MFVRRSNAAKSCSCPLTDATNGESLFEECFGSTAVAAQGRIAKSAFAAQSFSTLPATNDPATKMDDFSQILVEVHRLQMLAFIGRPTHAAPFSTPSDLARWLRIPVSESSLLVAELVEEGFVHWGTSVSGPQCAPLALTELGRGVLEWNRRRAATDAPDPEVELDELPRMPPP